MPRVKSVKQITEVGRCKKWISGQQCSNFTALERNYCALHFNPRTHNADAET